MEGTFCENAVRKFGWGKLVMFFSLGFDSPSCGHGLIGGIAFSNFFQPIPMRAWSARYFTPIKSALTFTKVHPAF
jgi:hypothetical protein